MKIKKGDEIVVLQGKDRGKRGRVAFAFPADDKVIVDGINTAKRHTKPTKQGAASGILTKDMPIQVSNVAIVCPSCGKGVRVGYRFDADGSKQRICRSCEGDLS